MPVRSVKLKLPMIGDPERHPVRPLPLPEVAPELPEFVVAEPLVPELVVAELLLPTPVPVEPVAAPEPWVVVPDCVPDWAPDCEFGVVALPVPFWSVEVPGAFEVPGALVLGLVCAGCVELGLLVPGELVFGEEVCGVGELCGVAAGLLCVCADPVLDGVLSGALLCASTHVPDSSTKETSVALPFIAVTPPDKFV